MTSRYLTRREAAQYLTREGFPCSPKTLAKLACQGGGPSFIKFGLRVLYRPDDLINWAVNRCCWRSSTSDPGTPLHPPGTPTRDPAHDRPSPEAEPLHGSEEEGQ